MGRRVGKLSEPQSLTRIDSWCNFIQECESWINCLFVCQSLFNSWDWIHPTKRKPPRPRLRSPRPMLQITSRTARRRLDPNPNQRNTKSWAWMGLLKPIPLDLIIIWIAFDLFIQMACKQTIRLAFTLKYWLADSPWIFCSWRTYDDQDRQFSCKWFETQGSY